MYLMLLVPFLCFSINTRSIGFIDEEKESQNVYVGKQYLLVIGISKYLKWFPLANPVDDTREIKNILTTHYYIDEVRELYDENATKAMILKVFYDLQTVLTEDDSLLVLYAGHGHYDQTTKTGFWIPYDAGTDEYEQEHWIPNQIIHGLISNMKAAHICLITDSCFSGDILNITRGKIKEIEDGYFKKAYALISRQVITSGALEAVPDTSSFCRMLKIVLRKNISPYLDPMMLFNEIRLGVTETTPLFGSLKGSGHQEGASFLLFLKKQEINRADGLSRKNDEKTVGEANTVLTDTFPDASSERNMRKSKYPFLSEKFFFSIGLGLGLMIPLGDVEGVMDPGTNPDVSFRFNLSMPWGICGFGIYAGAGSINTNERFAPSYTMLIIPVEIQVSYMTSFFFPLYGMCRAGCGISLNSITYNEVYAGLDDFTTGKFYLSAGLGAGYILFPRLWIEVNADCSMIFFDNTLYTDVKPGIELVLTF